MKTLGPVWEVDLWNDYAKCAVQRWGAGGGTNVRDEEHHCACVSLGENYAFVSRTIANETTYQEPKGKVKDRSEDQETNCTRTQGQSRKKSVSKEEDLLDMWSGSWAQEGLNWNNDQGGVEGEPGK